MKRIVLVLLLSIAVNGPLFGQTTNRHGRPRVDRVSLININPTPRVNGGEFVSSGTIYMRGRTLDTKDDNVRKHMYYLQNADSLEYQITVDGGSVYNLKADISTLTQKAVILSDKIRLSDEAIVTLKLGDTLIYRIDGVYNQLLKSDGKISLGVVKFVEVDMSAQERRIQQEMNARIKRGESLEGASSGVALSMNLDRKDNVVALNYEYKEQLFLILEGKRYSPSKKNFNSLFSDRKEDIKRYLKEYKIRLSKNEGIVTLFDCLTERR